MFVRDLNVPKMYMCENILQPKAENLEDISGQSAKVTMLQRYMLLV